MGLLDQLLQGGSDRDRYDQFARRYDEGRPHEGYDDDEVAGHYRSLERDVDDDTYRLSARDAFERMDPREREEFAHMLRGAARERGHGDLDRDDDRYGDPDHLARYTGEMRRRDPDLLSGLLGGGAGMGGGALGGLGGLLGGGGGGGGGGGLLGGAGGGGGNPVARAALAGITAMAAKRLMSGR